MEDDGEHRLTFIVDVEDDSNVSAANERRDTSYKQMVVLGN